MKCLTLAMMAGVLALAGCASAPGGERIADAGETSYVPLGTSIPKKGARRAEDKTLDLQQLENAQMMNNGTGSAR